MQRFRNADICSEAGDAFSGNGCTSSSTPQTLIPGLFCSHVLENRTGPQFPLHLTPPNENPGPKGEGSPGC